MINKIDYRQDWGNQNSSFDVELSFTWLDWNIMDIFNSKSSFEIDDFSESQELQMCFNILPNGYSWLHLLAFAK